MKSKILAIELLDDCVFSARSATEGGHESLDRIPGATLLGAAAGRLYKALSPADAWTVFHSGKFRFGDGLPILDGDFAYPIPYAWHHAKLRKPAETRGVDSHSKRLHEQHIYNFLHIGKIGGDAQPKQMRTGYVCADGRWVSPQRALRLKTAIDPATGRAAESQLFGYDALVRGQSFATFIEADDDLDETLFDSATAALTGEVLLGRSRSAEYGRAWIEAGTGIQWPRFEAPTEDMTATLWLLSDLALCDKHGQSTLTPDGDSLRISGARVDWNKTFLRQRRYSPWNAFRHGYDRERLVLAAGGVITLDLPEPLTEIQIAQLQHGIGLHREAGLGRLWVNPPLLENIHPHFQDAVQPFEIRSPAKPDHPLIHWLETQSGDWKRAAEERARKLADEYSQQIGIARRLAGVGERLDFGPSRSQWGRVLEAARSRQGQALFDTLFTGDDAIVKPEAEGWKEEVRDSADQWRKLSEWLKEKLRKDKTDSDKAYAHLVRQFAHWVRTDLDRRGN